MLAIALQIGVFANIAVAVLIAVAYIGHKGDLAHMLGRKTLLPAHYIFMAVFPVTLPAFLFLGFAHRKWLPALKSRGRKSLASALGKNAPSEKRKAI